MRATAARPTFEDRSLQRQIMQLRQVDNHTNLFYLAIEYFCLFLVIGGAVTFAEYRQTWGLPWSWNVPVFAAAIILIGALQHRLAGLGHESSHYSFMKNRYLNDLIPDIFCMFPLMTTIHFYRLFHMGHHQYTNDPARDPDLLNLGHGKRADEFPMPRWRFIAMIYFSMIVARRSVPAIPVGLFQGEHAREREEHLSGSRFRRGGRRHPATAGDDSRHRLHPRLFMVLRFLTGTDRPLWLAPAGTLRHRPGRRRHVCSARAGRCFNRRFARRTHRGSRASCA